MSEKEKVQKNPMAEAANWNARCITEEQAPVKWTEAWGQMFPGSIPHDYAERIEFLTSLRVFHKWNVLLSTVWPSLFHDAELLFSTSRCPSHLRNSRMRNWTRHGQRCKRKREKAIEFSLRRDIFVTSSMLYH